MKIIRAILAGIIVWVLMFSIFVVLSFIPVVKNSEMQQGLIMFIFIIPAAWLGAVLYYKTGYKTNGIKIGFIMVIIALILEAIITVPLLEIPYNGSYLEFFTNPILWILMMENMVVPYFYWKFKIKPKLN